MYSNLFVSNEEGVLVVECVGSCFLSFYAEYQTKRFKIVFNKINSVFNILVKSVIIRILLIPFKKLGDLCLVSQLSLCSTLSHFSSLKLVLSPTISESGIQEQLSWVVLT